MVSEIIGLLELVRSLVQRKSEIDKEYFENFIQPIWQKFDAVHQEYVRVFLSCKEYFPKRVDDVRHLDPGHMIELASILDNSALQHSERVELEKLLQYLPTQRYETKSEILLLNFSRAIMIYFDGLEPFSALSRFRYLSRTEHKKDSVMSFKLSQSQIEQETVRRMELKSLRRHLADTFRVLNKSDKLNGENTDHVIDVMLRYIQRHYEEVTDRYYELRKELLT